MCTFCAGRGEPRIHVCLTGQPADFDGLSAHQPACLGTAGRALVGDIVGIRILGCMSESPEELWTH